MPTKSEVFANVREMLAMAEAGFKDATSSDPTRRRPGLMNLITYGRSVTFAIQTIKNLVTGFDEWWNPYQQRMRDDPLMKYFNETRNTISKEGSLKTSTTTVIGASGPVNLGALMAQLQRDAPPNTVSTFLGEGSTGGNGWNVKMPDGSIDKVYFALPEGIDIKSDLHMPDPPKSHDNKPITDTSAPNLARLYIESLREIVNEFEEKWS
jgi:hypothetical protein